MRTVLSTLLACTAFTPALAGSLMTGVQDARLLHGWRTGDGTHMAAIEINLEKGWKTYWRAPGPLGIPPNFVWTGSDNLKSVRTIWPTPSVFDEKYGQSIGYEDFLVLPVELTPISSGPIHVKLTMDFGVCKDICVPARAHLSGRFYSDLVKSKSDIDFALRSTARKAKTTGHKINCHFDPHEDGLQIKAKVTGQSIPSKAVLVFEHLDKRIWFDRTTLKRSEYELRATTVLNLPRKASKVVQRSDIRVTMLGGLRATEFTGCSESN